LAAGKAKFSSSYSTLIRANDAAAGSGGGVDGKTFSNCLICVFKLPKEILRFQTALVCFHVLVCFQIAQLIQTFNRDVSDCLKKTSLEFAPSIKL
jgi:hypothetical protein